MRAGTDGAAFGGVFALDRLTLVTRLGVIGLALLTVALAGNLSRLANAAEYLALILFATAGFTLMAASNQLLLAFLALELASLSLYVLAGFDKTRPESAEAGLKYFLFGGVSAAFMLFGFSLLYGLTGSIAFPEIARQLAAQPPSALLVVALVMVLVAFGFKAAAAPFHLWAPDVYEGAPVGSAALIASASKLAGVAFFARLLWAGIGAPVAATWLPVLAILAAASLVLGNVAALAQSNVRRLLAYSAISHAGALVLGVMVAGRSPGAVVYYALTYGLATVGAFGVIAALEAAAHDRVAVLAIDLPNLPARWLAELAASASENRGVVGRRGRIFEPLAAVYPRKMLPLARAALNRGDRALQPLLHAAVTAGLLRVRRITTAEAPWFLNLNTPEAGRS